MIILEEKKKHKISCSFNVLNSSKLTPQTQQANLFAKKKSPLASNRRRRHPIAYSSIIALQLLHCLCAAAASPPPLLPPSPLPLIAKPKYTPPYPQPSP